MIQIKIVVDKLVPYIYHKDRLLGNCALSGGEMMQLSKEDIENIVKKVLEEADSVNTFSMTEDENVKGTVALFTAFVPSKHACACKLAELYGTDLECALFDGVSFKAPGCVSFPVDSDADREALLEKLAGKAEVAVVTPKLSLIYELADGNDSGFICQAILRPLLWGRRVRLLLDFEIPRFKRATFFERVVDSIDRLTNMGVIVDTFRPSGEPNKKQPLELVTEREITEAHQSGANVVYCDKDAIVTPLAKDRAAELGVAIEW